MYDVIKLQGQVIIQRLDPNRDDNPMYDVIRVQI